MTDSADPRKEKRPEESPDGCVGPDRQRARLLDAFERIGRMAQSSLDRDEIVDRLALEVLRAGIFRSIAVGLVDEEQNALTITRSYYRPRNELGAQEIVPQGIAGLQYPLDSSDITAEVARTGRFTVIDGWDPRFDPRFTSKSGRQGQVAYFIPLKTSRVIGVLATGSTLADKEELLTRIDAMQPLLAQTAVVIEHATLYQRTRESERLYRRLVTSLPHGIVEVDADGRIAYANPALCRMLEYSSEELTGSHLWEFNATAEDSHHMEQRVKAVLRDEPEPKPYFTRVRTKTGSIRNLQMDWDYERNRAGQPIGTIAILTDVTERREAENALEESEAKYRSLFELAGDANFLMSLPDTQVVEANVSAHELLGYEPGELVGLTARSDIVAPEAVEATDRERARQLQEAGWYRVESVLKRKDGSRVPVFAVGKLMEISGERMLQLVVRDITELKRAESSMREFSRRTVHLQEEERRRVARELHDGVNQLLSAASAQLHMAGLQSCETTGGNRSLQTAERYLDEAIDEVRRISRDLRPTVLDDLGLEAALRNLSKRMTGSRPLVIDVTCPGSEAQLSTLLETTIYRVVQEALSNVARHAQATQAAVRVEVEEKVVLVVVSDDGRGFDVDAARAQSAGIGLRSMEERAALMHGSLSVESAQGKGTWLRFSFPHAEDHPFETPQSP